jgi:pyrimidine operon attenuation protein/uracil phosphoribosyltransferase
MKQIILNDQEIAHKTKRIAYQIYETFCEEEEVILAGISKNGYVFATRIAAELAAISPLKVVLCEVFINKQNPKDTITTSLAVGSFEDKGLVLIDDVLHSGTTLIYSVKYFLDFTLRKFS